MARHRRLQHRSPQRAPAPPQGHESCPAAVLHTPVRFEAPAPNYPRAPTSGFLLMIPKDDLIYLDMTFEEASKFIVSAGTSKPKS